MDNYRKHIAAYNQSTADENGLIAKHNYMVRSYRKENELTEVQQKFWMVFEMKHFSLSPRKYNEFADAFCKEILTGCRKEEDTDRKICDRDHLLEPSPPM